MGVEAKRSEKRDEYQLFHLTIGKQAPELDTYQENTNREYTYAFSTLFSQYTRRGIGLDTSTDN